MLILYFIDYYKCVIIIIDIVNGRAVSYTKMDPIKTIMNKTNSIVINFKLMNGKKMGKK